MQEINTINGGIVGEPVFCTTTAKRSRLHDNFGEDTKGRRLHPVWEYFTVLDNTTMECLVCSRKFKTISSTTVCKHHLKSKHPDLFAQLADEQTDWRNRVSTSSVDGTGGGRGVEHVEGSHEEKAIRKLLSSVSCTSDFSSDDEKLKLLIIMSVKDRPAIWNSSHEAFCNPPSVENLFTEIAQEISDKWRIVSADEVIQIWNKLMAAHNISRRGQENEECGEKKEILDAMKFLRSTSPSIKPETTQTSVVKLSKQNIPQGDTNFCAISNLFTPFSLFSQNTNLLNNQSNLSATIETTPSFSSTALNTEFNTTGVGIIEENRDESTPLGFLVVDLHRKLRQKQKLGKALQFKRNLFNLISEFEQEFI